MPRPLFLLGRTVLAHDLDCPDCNAPMLLTVFSGGSGGERLLYRCSRHKSSSPCNGNHSANPDGSPLGVPAPWPVRALRKKAHGVFDLLWRGPSRKMDRDAAYRWLQDRMDMTADQAHISRFDAAQCGRVLALVRAEFGIEPEPELGGGREWFELRL